MINQIKPTEFNIAVKKHKDTDIFIDVRTKEEFEEVRIGGVRNIPLDELIDHLDELKKYENIYLHCAAGPRSEYACQQLSALGHKNLFNLDGGIYLWMDQGYETEPR